MLHGPGVPPGPQVGVGVGVPPMGVAVGVVVADGLGVADGVGVGQGAGT